MAKQNSKDNKVCFLHKILYYTSPVVSKKVRNAVQNEGIEK